MPEGDRNIPDESYLLRKLLREVSRSFYLTLRVLPGKIRSQIGLAYLLARTSDTIADTDILPANQRLDALRSFQKRVRDGETGMFSLQAFAQAQKSNSEAMLLGRIDEMMACLESFPSPDQHLIRSLLETIIGGQELDLIRFNGAESSGTVAALETPSDLDDYSYRVAGCVGEFWTRICQAQLFDGVQLPLEFSIENGIRFGKGLQLINILRDIPRDLRQGRCYLPAEELRKAGLHPSDLLDSKNESRVRPLYDRWLDKAEQHLTAGWTYTKAIPRTMFRLRLACAWPILIGHQTLERLRTGAAFDPERRIKISRANVRKIIFQTVLYYPNRAKWGSLLK